MTRLLGRFSCASSSDYIGRKSICFVYISLGFAFYATVPYAGASGNVVLFVVCFLIIVSMYGGGFSTVPAYLRDMFGTGYVGAIHGIRLTAWLAADVARPALINYVREYNVTHGVPKAQADNTTMYIVAGLLVVGFLDDLCIKAVDKRYHMKSEVDAEIEPARAQAAAGQRRARPNMGVAQMKALSHRRASALQISLSWSADLVSRAAASMKPKHRAGQIAAVVAETGNPSGT